MIDAFAELYEMEDENILVVDAGRYGFVKLQCYTPSYGFEELDTYTDSHSLFEGLWNEWLSLNLFLIVWKDRMNKMDSAGVTGIVEMLYNWLSYGVIHDGIGSYENG